jgi:hypothetical protein
MSTDGFQPRFIAPGELATYGLPTQADLPTIMTAVEAASKLIDEHCGRTDGDGNGSLAYATYTERLYMQSPGRNLFRLSFKPLKALDQAVQASLLAIEAVSGAYYYSGFVPNTIFRTGTTTLSPLLSVSGRYAFARRDSAKVFPDFGLGANPLQIAGIMGSPPPWNNIDVSAIDFDTQTGELWVPVGIYGYQYQEVIATYNAGFDPTNLPRSIKHACSAVVKNYISRGGGVTGLKSLVASKVHATFGDSLIDSTVERWLQNYVTVMAY